MKFVLVRIGLPIFISVEHVSSVESTNLAGESSIKMTNGDRYIVSGDPSDVWDKIKIQRFADRK